MDLTDIENVMETNDIGEVNRLLSDGWVLLVATKPPADHDSGNGPGFWYSLGRPKDLISGKF